MAYPINHSASSTAPPSLGGEQRPNGGVFWPFWKLRPLRWTKTWQGFMTTKMVFFLWEIFGNRQEFEIRNWFLLKLVGLSRSVSMGETRGATGEQPRNISIICSGLNSTDTNKGRTKSLRIPRARFIGPPTDSGGVILQKWGQFFTLPYSWWLKSGLVSVGGLSISISLSTGFYTFQVLHLSH